MKTSKNKQWHLTGDQAFISSDPASILKSIFAKNAFQQTSSKIMGCIQISEKPDEAYTELLKRSACVEIPELLFNQALDLAASGDIELGNHENHPAIQLLCEWWNTHAPNPDFRCAGAFEIFCLTGNQDELWPAYKDTPTIELSMFTEHHMEQCIARVGDRILILFLKPLCQCEDFDYYHNWNRVDGECWIDVSCPLKDADNAWWTWKSMEEFRRNFPEISQGLKHHSS